MEQRIAAFGKHCFRVKLHPNYRVHAVPYSLDFAVRTLRCHDQIFWQIIVADDQRVIAGGFERRSDALENTKQYEVLDLEPWLEESGFGWVGLSWNFSRPNSEGVRSSWRQANLQLQVTDLGITVRYGYNRILVWVHSLSSNEPVSDALVQLMQENQFIVTLTGRAGRQPDHSR